MRVTETNGHNSVKGIFPLRSSRPAFPHLWLFITKKPPLLHSYPITEWSVTYALREVQGLRPVACVFPTIAPFSVSFRFLLFKVKQFRFENFIFSVAYYDGIFSMFFTPITEIKFK